MKLVIKTSGVPPPPLIPNFSSRWILDSFSLEDGLNWLVIQYFIFRIHAVNACVTSV